MEGLSHPSGRRRFRWQGILAGVVLAILSLTFLFSAVSKLAGMDAFRWALLDAGIRNDRLAAIGARVLVGVELGLGLLLLTRIGFRRVAYPLALLLLGLFSAYLLVMVVRQGNAGDCGCFGDWLPMRPVPALLKNGALAIGLFAVRKLRVWEPRLPQAVPAAIVAVGIAAPFIATPLRTGNERLDLTPLYRTSQLAAAADLRRGRHVVAFMSLGCPHCREAAKIFHRFLTENPALPVELVLNGTPDAAADFFNETHAQNVPHRFVPDLDAFVKMAGQYVPSIYYVNDGRIERRVSYRSMTRPAIETWAGL